MKCRHDNVVQTAQFAHGPAAYGCSDCGEEFVPRTAVKQARKEGAEEMRERAARMAWEYVCGDETCKDSACRGSGVFLRLRALASEETPNA